MVEGERLLSHFDAETAMVFSAQEQKRKAYVKAFRTLIRALIADIERSDALGIRLGQLLVLAQHPDNEHYEPSIREKWEMYEHYHGMLIQYLEETRDYMKIKAAQKEMNYTSMLRHTRNLVQNARAYADEFSFDVRAIHVEN